MEAETLKKILIFQETKLSYISGNGISELKNKKNTLKMFLIFYEMELSYFLRVPKNKFTHSSSELLQKISMCSIK